MHPDLPARAAHFLSLHVPGDPLVLLNAWDPGTARLFQGLGAKAVGTTSMGISAAEGFPEGQVTPWIRMHYRIASIAAAVTVPVTADIESGYADKPEGVAANVTSLVNDSVVGINIEDSAQGPGSPLLEPEILIDRLRAARAASEALGIHLVINARPDTFLAGGAPPADLLREAISRANRYRAAGADCIFVPGARDPDHIETLVREIDAPINIVANPAIGADVPTIPHLADLGVARVSVGSALMRASLAFTARAATEILSRGAYDTAAEELHHPDAPASYRMAIGENA
jgi:2-methylisocitrate lyase-like PEP mutase family enzyme